MDPRVGSMLTAYGANLAASWPVALSAVLALGFATFLIRRSGVPAVRRVALGLALAFGLGLAWQQMSVFDDAFVSFRYARNLANGDGLVWNRGEYVQGFTNPLWTLAIAAGLLVLPEQAPYLALAGNGLSFVLNVVVVYAIGRRVNPGGGFVPLAAILVAVQNTVTAFASSGMETQLASLLVNLSLLALVSRPNARGALLAGLAAAASTLTRPDHAIFHGAAALVVLARVAPELRLVLREPKAWWRAGLDRIVGVLAPAALFAGWLGFSVWYYGDSLPNTYYAKSAHLWYPSNGLVYSLSFWLGSHLWIAAPWLGLWALRRARSAQERDLKLFVLAACVVQQAYVVKVGGDFMYGRFFLAVVPLLLLGVEALWHDLVAHRRALAGAVLVTLLSTAGGGTLAHHDWWISDESANYEVVSLFPLTIGHSSFREAQAMRALGDPDLRPTIGTCCIGMTGWYVDTELIDFRGLTDRRVARAPLAERGMPGHEKWATEKYIRRRDVKLARRSLYRAPYEALTKISWMPGDRGRWYIVGYDRELMDTLRERISEAEFVDFDQHLRRYVARMHRLDAGQLARDLAFFDAYWFRHNRDEGRRNRIMAALDAARSANGKLAEGAP